MVLGGEMEITKDLTIAELLTIDSGFIPILMNAGMHCIGCAASSSETIEEACEVHGIECDDLMAALKAYYATTK